MLPTSRPGSIVPRSSRFPSMFEMRSRIRRFDHGRQKSMRHSDDLFQRRAERRGGESDFVFMSQKGVRLSVSQVWRIVKALADEANATKRVSPHTWRHSIAAKLLDAGAPA